MTFAQRARCAAAIFFLAAAESVRFRVDEREYVVEELLDQWYGPEEAWYKVRADDGNIYILRQQTSVPDGSWDLASFRKPA